MEAENGLNGKLPAHSFERLFPGAGACQNQLNPVPVFGAVYGLNEYRVALFLGIASGGEDDKFALQRLRLLCLNGPEGGVYAVGDYIAVGFSVHSLVQIPQELGGVVNGVHLAVCFAEEGVDGPVYRSAVLQKDMAGHILRHDMKTGADGNALLLRKENGPPAQGEGQHHMDHIRSLYCLSNYRVVGLCQSHTVAGNVPVENAQVSGGHHGIARKARLLPVGTQYGYLMTPFLQKGNEIHGSQGGAVVGFTQNIADNSNLHGFNPLPKYIVRCIIGLLCKRKINKNLAPGTF